MPNKHLLTEIDDYLRKKTEADFNLFDKPTKSNKNQTNFYNNNKSPVLSNFRTKGSRTLYSSHKLVKTVKEENFKILKVIGRGSYGKVCLVEYLPRNEIYAMKSLKKDLLIQEEQVECTLLEKEIMETVDHPFICKLVFCFQTEDRINFVMPFIPGGELFEELKRTKFFSEDRAKFYLAQIALAIQYLHDKGIIYRDLKPENVLIDENGYLKIADFGLSKKIENNELTYSFCGTPEYLAPEVINEEGHDKNVDWWSLGIILYEMLFGIPPFYLKDLNKLYDLIKSGEPNFPKQYPISKEAKDLIKKLLVKDVKKRFGYNKGLEEIKNHPFFNGVDFDAILNKKVKAPYIPQISGNTDVQHFSTTFTNESLAMSFIGKKEKDMVKANQELFNKFPH